MHAGHDDRPPFPGDSDIHAELRIILDGQTITIPPNVGATADGSDLANPHTHAADNVLHMHPLNGVNPEHLFTVGEFFDVWRTNGGAAGNNPSALFSSTQLMDRANNGTQQVAMKVNGHFVRDFQNYVMHNNDEIELFMATLSAPTLAEIPSQTVLAGAPSVIGLDGFDADGDALTYTVESSNPAIAATLLSENNRSMRFEITHASSGQGQNGDPAFSGEIIFELFEDLAPRTTARIVELAQSGFYSNRIFHRIIDNFMVQGGDPTGTGTGGSGIDFDDEFHVNLQHTTPGLLSMAKSSDDTNDSQFFITEVPTRHLDFNHSIFGRVVEGDAIRETMSEVAVDGDDKPLADVRLTSASIFHDDQNRTLMISAPPGTAGSSTITVTATDMHGNSVQGTFQVNVQADSGQNSNGSPFLHPINTVFVSPGQTTQIQLQSTDVEGDSVTYLDHNVLQQSFLSQVPIVPNPDTPNPNDFRRLPINPNLTATVDPNSGLLTITANANAVGPQYTLVGVKNGNNVMDLQQIHVMVLPPAVGSISLSPLSDTGARDSDDVTARDNSGASSVLSFDVTGVTPGAKVTLYDGVAEIGSAIASNTAVTIATNGSHTLTNGVHGIAAKMSMSLDPNLDTGGATGFIALPDNLAASTQITVSPNDFHNHTISQDSNGDGVVQPLDVLVIINHINANPTTNEPSGSHYLDVSNDGTVSALDVLQVINYINANPSSGLTGQGLAAADASGDSQIAQGLAAPARAAPANDVGEPGEDAGAGDAETACGPVESVGTSSEFNSELADNGLGVSAGDREDLEELIELLALQHTG